MKDQLSMLFELQNIDLALDESNQETERIQQQLRYDRDYLLNFFGFKTLERSYLLRYARLQLRDPALAEDAVQETLLAALEGAARFAGKSSLRTWLTGILKHKIIDHLRRAGREPP